MSYTHAYFAALNCPKPVTWVADIKGLFTSTDVAHMKNNVVFSVDLSDYTQVKTYARKIYTEVSNGNMPPPGSGENAWTADMVNTFGCWNAQGCPEQ